MKIRLELDQDLIIEPLNVDVIVISTFADLSNSIQITNFTTDPNGSKIIINMDYDLLGVETAVADIRKMIEDAVDNNGSLTLLECEVPLALQEINDIEAIPLISLTPSGTKTYSPQANFLKFLADDNDFRQKLITKQNILSVTYPSGTNAVNFKTSTTIHSGQGPIADQYSKLAQFIRDNKGIREKCRDGSIEKMNFIIWSDGGCQVQITDKQPSLVNQLRP